MSRSNDVSSSPTFRSFLVLFRMLCSILHLLRMSSGRAYPGPSARESGVCTIGSPSRSAGTTSFSATDVAGAAVVLVALGLELSLPRLFGSLLIQPCVLQRRMRRLVRRQRGLLRGLLVAVLRLGLLDRRGRRGRLRGLVVRLGSLPIDLRLLILLLARPSPG